MKCSLSFEFAVLLRICVEKKAFSGEDKDKLDARRCDLLSLSVLNIIVLTQFLLHLHFNSYYFKLLIYLKGNFLGPENLL